MATNKVKDPRQLPVQLNVQIPWSFREFLSAQAERDKTSLNKLCIAALRDKYGAEYDRQEAGKTRTATREVGATA
jgi:hypothetical protein